MIKWQQKEKPPIYMEKKNKADIKSNKTATEIE